jgi:hypothetical protein
MREKKKRPTPLPNVTTTSCHTTQAAEAGNPHETWIFVFYLISPNFFFKVGWIFCWIFALTATLRNTIFRDMTIYNLFVASFMLILLCLLLDPECSDDTIIRNAGELLQDTVLQKESFTCFNLKLWQAYNTCIILYHSLRFKSGYNIIY